MSIVQQAPVVVDDIGQANHDCLAKRRPGEPMFIILGRDPDGHHIVRAWAERRLAAGGDPDHANPVLELADRMRAYASDPANAPASAPPASAYPPATDTRAAALLDEALRIAEDMRTEAFGNIEAGYRPAHNQGKLEAATRIAEKIRALTTPPAEPSAATGEVG